MHTMSDFTLQYMMMMMMYAEHTERVASIALHCLSVRPGM